MGGRVAEEIFLGDISNGAASDIQQATWYAKKMVCEWGMSEKLGMVQYGEESAMSFLGRDLGQTRGYSEATAQEIDREVLTLVNSAYAQAQDIITTHRDAMEKITLALLEYETLDGKHIRDIIEHGHMLTPPPRAARAPEQSHAAGAAPRQSPGQAEGRRWRTAAWLACTGVKESRSKRDHQLPSERQLNWLPNCARR